MNLVGIKNSLKPTLQAFAELTNNGLSGDAHQARRARTRRGVSGGRLRQSAGADLSAKLPELFGRFVAEHSAAQPRRAIGLRHQPDRNSSKRIEPAKEHQSSSRGRAERGDRPAAGSREIRRRDQVPGICSNRPWSADQRKYQLGAGTVFQVIQDQRDLASAVSSECKPWRITVTPVSLSIRRWEQRWKPITFRSMRRSPDVSRGHRSFRRIFPAEVRP